MCFVPGDGGLDSCCLQAALSWCRTAQPRTAIITKTILARFSPMGKRNPRDVSQTPAKQSHQNQARKKDENARKVAEEKRTSRCQGSTRMEADPEQGQGQPASSCASRIPAPPPPHLSTSSSSSSGGLPPHPSPNSPQPPAQPIQTRRPSLHDICEPPMVHPGVRTRRRTG